MAMANEAADGKCCNNIQKTAMKACPIRTAPHLSNNLNK